MNFEYMKNFMDSLIQNGLFRVTVSLFIKTGRKYLNTVRDILTLRKK